MIAGLVLLIIAFFGAWYTIQGSGSLGADYNINLFLSKLEAKGTFMGQAISVSMNYAEAKVNTQNLGVNTNSFAVIDTAMVLTIIAIISAVIAVVGMLAFVFGKGKPVYTKYLGGGFGMLTFILALVPALYFMSTGFAQESTGFWFSESVLGVTLSGGPGYAWYLMLATAIIALIASAAMLVKKASSPEATPPEVT
jgi:uncharacterized membrane protein required for colicin V production